MLEVIQSNIYQEWFAKLKDNQARARINARIRQCALHEEYLGDFKLLSGGIVEMRFASGPGYRVYCSIRRGRLLLLLAGGDKSTQGSDIKKARDLLDEWECANGD